jgi:hypothetical protein
MFFYMQSLLSLVIEKIIIYSQFVEDDLSSNDRLKNAFDVVSCDQR